MAGRRSLRGAAGERPPASGGPAPGSPLLGAGRVARGLVSQKDHVQNEKREQGVPSGRTGQPRAWRRPSRPRGAAGKGWALAAPGS